MTSTCGQAVTVCIPAYRSERFIAHTLASVQQQTHTNLRVLIAIEPTPDYINTYDVCERFLSDQRFSVHVNSSVLGWAANIDRLLARVDSPYFVLLPHDDVWHPRYLEMLTGAVAGERSACVAYADMERFGHRTGRKAMALESGSVAKRLASFYLAGAAAVPWRGVTRSCVLEGGATFPNNQYQGFAVEVEWTQHLLSKGDALRIPLPLYYKRVFPPDVATVSSGWFNAQPRTELLRALEYHSEQLLQGIRGTGLPVRERELIELAHKTAMLRRFIVFTRSQIPLSPAQIQYAAEIRSKLGSRECGLSTRISSRLDVLLALNSTITGDDRLVETLLRASIQKDSTYPEPPYRLARLLLREKRLDEALLYATRAAELEPHPQVMNVHDIVQRCCQALTSRYA